jgi:hypothetical protein
MYEEREIEWALILITRQQQMRIRQITGSQQIALQMGHSCSRLAAVDPDHLKSGTFLLKAGAHGLGLILRLSTARKGIAEK